MIVDFYPDICYDTTESKTEEYGMGYLLLAILCSAMVSVGLRLSTNRVTYKMGMTATNYLSCLVVAIGYAGLSGLFPNDVELPRSLGLGALNGVIYLGAFLLFQFNIRKNGIVLASIFMKLGLLVPIVVSILVFHESPGVLQVLGFITAIAAIILINYEPGHAVKLRMELLLLLLGGGAVDVLSKVYDEVGSAALADQFLVATFAVALLLSLVMMALKKERFGKYELLLGVMIGIPNFFTAKLTLRALETVPAVVTYPTYSVGTILVVTLVGVLFFREKLRKQQYIAIGVILLALTLLNL